MPEEPQHSGWLPPRPPGAGEAPPAPSPRPEAPPPGPYRAVERPPSSPYAVAGIVAASIGLLALLLSAGLAYSVSGVLSAVALLCWRAAARRADAGEPGRPRQLRAALVLGTGVLVLSAVAFVTWLVLSANGISAQDLQDWLERERQRLQTR